MGSDVRNMRVGQLGHMSHESTHIMELNRENPLFWLGYPQPFPTLTLSLPTQKPL